MISWQTLKHIMVKCSLNQNGEMIMRKSLILFLLLIVLAIPFSVLGQLNPVVSSLEVDLWPEYDRPDMLVIYKVHLSSTTALPVDLRLRIPADAGEPNAVAMRQLDGALLNAVYSREVDGQWAWINVTATSPDIQLEYYDPNLNRQNVDRHYLYNWIGDYKIESFHVKIQRPLGSSSLRVTPDLGKMMSGDDGFMYYVLDVGAVDIGQDFSVEMDYIKDTDALSIEGLQVRPSAPITEDTQGKMQIFTFLPWVLGGLGILLVGGGLVWYWRSEREVMGSVPRLRRRPEHGDDQTIRGSDVKMGESVVYCHQCGKRAEPGDRFCRSCGVKLKR